MYRDYTLMAVFVAIKAKENIMHHYFNTEIAKGVGVNAAVILENIAHWVLRNKANNKNFYDGHYWTFNSKTAMAELFPYMSQKQVNTALDTLRKANMVITGNYNKSSYDRTLWYSISDNCAKQFFPELIHCPCRDNGLDGKGQPIPDINTNNKPDNNISLEAPIPAESERTDNKMKSVEIDGEDESSLYLPKGVSPQNSAAGMVEKKPLVKKLTGVDKAAMLGKVYGTAYKIQIEPVICLELEDNALAIGDAFDFWTETATYRENARDAYIDKFLEAWKRVLLYHENDFYKRVRGADGHTHYMWQNVIAKYAENWSKGTHAERRENEAKDALGSK